AVAFVLVTAAQQGTQLLYVARWWGVRCHVGPVPGFLLLGAVGVVLSRALGLEPGLVLGTLIAFRTARPLREDEEGPAVALAATALTALGGAAWIVREPLVALAGEPGTFLPDTVATALTATAVSSAANLLFALVPLSFLPGAALLRWSPGLWALFACIGGFAFVHLAIRPSSDALGGGAGALGVLLGVYLLGAAALWAWLRRGPWPRPAAPQGTAGRGTPPGPGAVVGRLPGGGLPVGSAEPTAGATGAESVVPRDPMIRRPVRVPGRPAGPCRSPARFRCARGRVLQNPR